MVFIINCVAQFICQRTHLIIQFGKGAWQYMIDCAQTLRQGHFFKKSLCLWGWRQTSCSLDASAEVISSHIDPREERCYDPCSMSEAEKNVFPKGLGVSARAALCCLLSLSFPAPVPAFTQMKLQGN